MKDEKKTLRGRFIQKTFCESFQQKLVNVANINLKQMLYSIFIILHEVQD